MSTIGTWCHSQSEMFVGNCATREAAIEEGLEYYEGENFRIGQVVHALDLVSIDIDKVLEDIELQLYDAINYEEQILELPKNRQEELREIIEKFLRDHASFNSHGVTNIEDLRFDEDQKE